MNSEELIEKQLKANEEALKGTSMADLVDPNSPINKLPVEDRIKEPISEDPLVDADGNPIIQTAHTLKSDILNAVKQDNLTLSKIALTPKNPFFAESGSKEVHQDDFKMKTLIVSLITLFVLAGIGAMAFVIFRNNIEIDPVITENVRKIMSAEETQKIDISRTSKMEFFAITASESLKIPKNKIIREIVPEIKLVDGTMRKSTATEFLSSIGARAPEPLTRSLYPGYFIGTHFIGKAEPFMVFFVSSYEIAYPSLNKWESDLKDDFINYFEPQATSTREYTFKDRIVANQDTRALEDKDGNIIFFYTIVDSNTLIFANSSETLREILERMKIERLRR